jgi:ATP-dependent Clp endopeptidase proteolytic subunit ClpP
MEYGARPLRSTRRLENRVGQRPGWYKITNSQSGPTMVSIYDEIGLYGVEAIDFQADLKAIKGDIELHISSKGGDVFDGIAIYNTLKQRKGNVHVIVDSIAASAASFIAMAASPGLLEMAPHSELMIHDGLCMAIGNAADMRDLADQLDRVSDNIASIYAERTGKPAEYWRDKMRAETWFTDQQAVDEGLADGIHGKPRDPDHDGDDDSTAEGDTDHDYVKPDGSPGPKAKPGNQIDVGALQAFLTTHMAQERSRA